MSPAEKVESELQRGENLSLIGLVDAIIEHAYAVSSSDIHIDPLEGPVRVRFRIDGVLHDVHLLPHAIKDEVISRIKVLTGLRMDEHNAAQDGRFRFSSETIEHPIDVRVSIVPTYYGENAVLRLLADNKEHHTLETLGFSASDREKLMHAVRRPHGMVLATGPTGSGKTTTLYSLIKMLNTSDVSIITIEDPIEYSIEGIEQIQVNSRTGLTFANGLRSILRQDPNIVMVGEIRDPETAGIAVNTALTGHLLLSTLHTNDAATTLPRLLDLGIEAYLVASTVNIAIAQRLVRLICQECKTERQFSDAELKSLQETLPLKNLKGIVFMEGHGCDACSGTGYKGRISVNEVLVVNSEIREAVLQKRSADDIRKIAIAGGMRTMLEDGLEKVRDGLTTVEEILRVVHE